MTRAEDKMYCIIFVVAMCEVMLCLHEKAFMWKMDFNEIFFFHCLACFRFEYVLVAQVFAY